MKIDARWNDEAWLSRVENWIHAQLAKCNLEPLGKLTKVSGWSLGHVYKQPTLDGDVYFKATAPLPLFANEAKLTHELSKHFPEQVAEVVAICPENQWMLCKSFGGALPENAAYCHWQGAFGQFSKLQIASSRDPQVWLENGCLARPIQALPAHLNDAFTVIESKRGLSERLLHQKERILKTLAEKVSTLEQYRLPESLVHGDLHIENIAKTNLGYLFFDWSDACISHPFIDGTYIYRMPDCSDKQELIESYLRNWCHLADMSSLQQAWSVAEYVCYAHQAVSYASMMCHLSRVERVEIEQAFINAFDRLKLDD